MKADTSLWKIIPSENTDRTSGSDDKPADLSAIPLPGAVKPLDLKGAYKPGINGKLVSPAVNGEPGNIEEWKILGLKKYGEMNYLTGSPLKGTSLFDLINENRLQASHLDIILGCITVLLNSSDRKNDGESCLRLSAAGTLLTDDGKVLFLPEKVIEGILPLQRGASPLWEETLFNPLLAGPENLVFGWSVLAYRFFIGKNPFPMEGDEKLLPVIRGHFPPLELEKPELNSRLTEFIHQGLKSPAEVDINTLYSLFSELAVSDGFCEKLKKEEIEARKEKAEKSFRRKQAKYSGKRFLRRKGTLLLIIAGVAVIVGGVLYTILSGALAPPITRGWEQQDVVEGFYRGINELDVELVDDCETDKAGKSRVDMVTSMFAISRVRMGYEHNNPYINAEEWAARADLSLEPGEQLYGIRDLKVKRISESVFKAEYEEWISYNEETADPSAVNMPPSIRGERITEELELVLKKETWMISGIKRLSTEKLNSPE